MSGFVLMHRSLIGHHAFRNDGEAMAFAWMILRASWKPVQVRYKGQSISLDRGQLAVSIRDLSAQLDRPKGWVERLLKRLKNETMIETQRGTRDGTPSGTGVTIITISNYDTFQAPRDSGGTASKTPDEIGAGQAQDTEQIREQYKQVTTLEDDSLSPAEILKSDMSEIASVWNAVALPLGLSRCNTISSKRFASLKERLKEHGLEEIKTAIRRIPHSTFLRGESGNWQGASFGWLIRPDSITNILEGKYDDRQKPKTARDTRDGFLHAIDGELGIGEAKSIAR